MNTQVPKGGARTLYKGYVDIEIVSLSDIIAKLRTQECYPFEYKGDAHSLCRYQETIEVTSGQNSVLVLPHGMGFGPCSFYITENRLWTTKDILGPPDENKFKDEVRRDIRDIQNIVKAKEDSWKITEAIHPWNVIY